MRRRLAIGTAALLTAAAGFGCGEKSEPPVTTPSVTTPTVPTTTVPTTPPATPTAPAQ